MWQCKCPAATDILTLSSVSTSFVKNCQWNILRDDSDTENKGWPTDTGSFLRPGIEVSRPIKSAKYIPQLDSVTEVRDFPQALQTRVNLTYSLHTAQSFLRS